MQALARLIKISLTRLSYTFFFQSECSKSWAGLQYRSTRIKKHILRIPRVKHGTLRRKQFHFKLKHKR